MQTVIPLFGCNPTRNDKISTTLMKHVSAKQFGQDIGTPASDPHLLILLANQELGEGRKGQARCLIEAAYEIFDRNVEANAFTLYQAS